MGRSRGSGWHVHFHPHQNLGSSPVLFILGLDYRQDFVDVGLFRRQERQSFATLLGSRIDERNLRFSAQQEIRLHPTLKTIVGLRHERFRFEVQNREGNRPTRVEYCSFTGPKASLIYSPWNDHGSDFFVNYGKGLHSNDARSVVSDLTQSALEAGLRIGVPLVVGKSGGVESSLLAGGPGRKTGLAGGGGHD